MLVQARFGMTRARAQGVIQAGQVCLPDGQTLDKPGARYPEDIPLVLREPPRFVSRGGDKLEGAFEAFGLDVAGKTALDVGASTGGFTDCLLQHGAAKVYAVDVGYGQLAWKLRQDPRVIVMERTNIRHLDPSQLPERPSFFTADCSFISLKIVLPPLLTLLAEQAEGIVLIKPQFEAGRAQVGKGGVVKDPQVQEQVVADVIQAAADLGFANKGVIPSPLLGPAGNKEFLAYLGKNEE